MPADESKGFVTFWGTRGSISTPGRATEKYGGNTPCVTIRCGDVELILDAGTGIRNLGIEYLEEYDQGRPNQPLHLFLSHTHWDHIQGLPFFLPAYKKEMKLTIYGSPKKERYLASVLKGQMDTDYFPVSMSAFAAETNIIEISEKLIHLGPISVTWQEQFFHPGGSVRYRFEFADKKIVYATDVELDSIFTSEGVPREKIELMEEYVGFIREADLLIADGQYTEEEYPQKTGWGHTSIPKLLEVAALSGVKQLAVFHHDPQHSDVFLDKLWITKGYKNWSEENHIKLFWAREGITLAV